MFARELSVRASHSVQDWVGRGAFVEQVQCDQKKVWITADPKLLPVELLLEGIELPLGLRTNRCTQGNGGTTLKPVRGLRSGTTSPKKVEVTCAWGA